MDKPQSSKKKNPASQTLIICLLTVAAGMLYFVAPNFLTGASEEYKTIKKVSLINQKPDEVRRIKNEHTKRLQCNFGLCGNRPGIFQLFETDRDPESIKTYYGTYFKENGWQELPQDQIARQTYGPERARYKKDCVLIKIDYYYPSAPSSQQRRNYYESKDVWNAKGSMIYRLDFNHNCR